VTARRTALVRAVGAMALVGLLAACGNNPSGQAAVVGSATVSDADVAASVEELRAQVTADKNAAPSFDEGAATVAVVDRKTRSLLLEEAARREGITVTQGEVDDLIQTTVDQQFGGDRTAFDLAIASQQNIPASDVSDFARDFLIQRKLGEKLAPGGDQQAVSAALTKYLSDLSKELGVEVAPRFGSWDDAGVGLGPVSNDLSTLPSPAAAAQ
jgi:hypothetical protein